jgi:hypothetical protein
MTKRLHPLILSVCLLWSATASLSAQEDKDTTHIQIGAMKVIMINEEGHKEGAHDVSFEMEDDDRLELTHWGGIDIGVNMLRTPEGKIGVAEAENAWLVLDYARSMSWRINLLEEKIRLVKDYAGILVGAGLTYNSYGLKNNFDVVKDDSLGTIGVYRNPDALEYTKNKLRASYINVPVMLEFNTSEDPDKAFHFAAGVVGGWRMGAMSKKKFEQDGEEQRLRRKSDFNFSDWSLDASVRVGFSDITLWANYGLTPVFLKDKGPEVYNLSVGVQFIPF